MEELMNRQTGTINMLIKVHELLKAGQPPTDGEILMIGSQEELTLVEDSLAEEIARKKLVSFSFIGRQETSQFHT